MDQEQTLRGSVAAAAAANDNFISINDDDFEVIHSGLDGTLGSHQDGSGSGSGGSSLTSSLALPPSLYPSTLLDDSLGGHAVSSPRNGNVTPLVEPLRVAAGETGIMQGSMVASHASQVSTPPESLASVRRTQEETSVLLEKHLKALEEFSLMADSVRQAAQSSTLTEQVDGLQRENETMRDNVHMMSEQIDALQQENTQLRARSQEYHQQVTMLGGRVASLEADLRASCAERDQLIFELTAARDDARHKAATVTQLTERITELMMQLNAAKMAMPLMQPTPQAPQLDIGAHEAQRDRLESEIAKLRENLSEECARRMQEHESRVYLEEQINGLRNFGSVPREQEDTTRVIQQLTASRDECDALRRQMDALRDQLLQARSDGETQQEIINAMSENEQEARRQLAEQERKMGTMQHFLRQAGYHQNFE